MYSFLYKKKSQNFNHFINYQIFKTLSSKYRSDLKFLLTDFNILDKSHLELMFYFHDYQLSKTTFKGTQQDQVNLVFKLSSENINRP